MPSFNNLLGFKDFGEALFAQSQLLADTRAQFPSYGNAQQAMLARLDEAVYGLVNAPTTAGIAVTPSADVSLTADYNGVIDGGQLPFDITVAVDLLGIDALADSRTEITYTPDGLVGSETADGTWTVTDVTKLAARLDIEVSFAGVVQGNWTVRVALVKDAAPPEPQPAPDPDPVPPPPGPPPPPVVTPAQSLTVTGAYSPDFALVGSLEVEGGFSYKAALNASLYPTDLQQPSGNVQVYIAIKPTTGGSWTMQGVVVDGTEYQRVLADIEWGYGGSYTFLTDEVLPGFVNISRDIVIPAGKHLIGFFARLSYGGAVVFGAKAVIEPL